MTAERQYGTGATAMQDRLIGILLGTAVGDSLGLPAEGLCSPVAATGCFLAPGVTDFCSAEAWSATTRNTPCSWLNLC